MRVLVTGGTGFVGSWTARAVEDAGHQLRFLVRTPAKLATSVGILGVDTSDFVVGDITDAGSVRTALEGCDAVVHCAAVVAIGAGAAEKMARTNLDGARNVLGQAAALGLDPAVHVSSLAAVFDPGLARLTAELPVAEGLDDYGASKAMVEKYVRELQEQGAPVHITYPGMVIGPPAGDQLGEATEGVRAALRLRVVPGRRAAWTVCDVRDLAQVHAADGGAPDPGSGAPWVRQGPGPPPPEDADDLRSDAVLHADAGVRQRTPRARARRDVPGPVGHARRHRRRAAGSRDALSCQGSAAACELVERPAAAASETPCSVSHVPPRR